MFITTILFFLLMIALETVGQLAVGGMRKATNSTKKELPSVSVEDEWNSLPDDAIPFPLIMQTTPMRAIAVLSAMTSHVRGSVVFEQQEANAPIIISGRISGLTPSGTHGFHIHSSGDMSNGCASVLSHFNPQNLVHGGPTHVFRHAGDLGNIQADENGSAVFSRPDSGISLSGAHSVLGRAIVIHAEADDLGLGNGTESRITGNAGTRIACGIIALTQPLA